MCKVPKVIAVAGKGGVGKTTLCGMLARYIIEIVKDGPVLAVDADPNANLNEILGVSSYATIGEIRELMKKDVPAGMTKDVWFEYKLQEAVIDAKGFDLLVMGRPEGPGCYCAANTLAKQSIDTLKTNYAYVLVDNEAGMEHMSRLVTQNVDMLVVVSDASPRGILTASRILSLIGELRLDIRKTYTIINKLRPPDETMLKEMAADKGIILAGLIRGDEEVTINDGHQKSIFELGSNSVAMKDAYAIFNRILE